MITYLILIGKSALAILLFSLFYHFVLAKDKLFKRNRYYLLIACISAIVFPLINIPVIETGTTQPFSLVYLEEGHSVSALPVVTKITFYSWVQVILVIYVAGIIFYLLKAIAAYKQVFAIIKKGRHTTLGKQKLVFTRRNLSPFSFFHWIVVPNIIHNHPSIDKIVQHEMVHCRQYHSVDLFIAEMLILLQWFNPFAWLLRKSISENLEFLVDEEMLINGTDAKDYQYSLLNFSMVGLKPTVANSFNTNLIKKRITMMNTRKYPSKNRFHSFLIPVCLVIALSFTATFQKEATAKETVSENKLDNPFVVLEEAKTVENKSQVVVSNSNESQEKQVDASEGLQVEELFLGYIMNNVKYPKEAININLEGIVEVPVTFTAEGAEVSTQQAVAGEKLKQIVVVAYANDETQKHSPVDPNSESIKLFQEEVSRVVKSFPYVPKELVGKSYIISVKFILEELKVTEFVTEKQVQNVNESVRILIRKTDNSVRSEPVYILNDEKIISKEEMEHISPNSIQSISVIKADKVEHKKLGVINGSVVVITLK